MFQQKWKAKQLVRAYHGDWIPEQKFKKGYLPNGLPPIVGNKLAGEAKVPLASMMFAEVEKRLDTVVFRCCFADSVYKARQLVIHGKVKLNGQKVRISRPLALHTALLINPVTRKTGYGCEHQTSTWRSDLCRT